ncbi:discoidin, CUB and LCCL domain-containing protein 2-like isoform X1 [Asterias amurensis]|uniref:discoidin, CUB and LCCL domain-containing protein 2-like isoform X1 n=2 Tax=Asterias amurensis TaxID=7602 RepID=UPI003AB258EE
MFTVHSFILVLTSCVVVLLTACICIVESRQMSSYYGPVPEPDPGQPYNKYHWVKSAMEKLRTGCPSKRVTSGEIAHAGSIETETTSSDGNGGSEGIYQPLGMGSGDVPDDSITSSSYHSTLFTSYPPKQARLNYYVVPWCAGGNDGSPWIQVDFNDNYVYITGLITKGYIDTIVPYYVMTYTVAYLDGLSLIDVKAQDGTPQEFTGNSDGYSPVTVKFDEALYSSVIRILPTSWKDMNKNENCCMYFEVLGYW